MFKSFLKFDWIIITSVLLLLGLSLAVLYPISYNGQESGGEVSNFFLRQAVFAGIGLVVFIWLSFVDYRAFKSFSAVVFLGGIFLLLLALIFGKTIRGTSGWIDLGIFSFQPVEPFKLITVVVLAKYFSVNSRTIGEFRHILISAVPVILSVILILKQPDLGSAIVVLGIWLGMLTVSGVKKKYLVFLLLLGLILTLVSWNFLLKEYQKERLSTLIDPFADPLGSGYNVIQSTVAVGSGEIWGKGLGHGSQSQLNFLPEKHTDFIFAVIAEELGFAGAIFVLVLLMVIMTRLLTIARNSQDNFGKMLASGIVTIIFIQGAVNIGMNIGIVPVAGIPLPFLSYGGSSLITMLAALGIAQSVERRGKVSP